MGRVDGGFVGPAVGSWLAHKWRLVRVIGSGGTATVYEAEHQNLSRVAIKVMHATAAGSPAQCRRFRLEGYAANRVNHPGTVRVFDDAEDDWGRPFLVMELLEGETVAERARREGGRLAVEEVVRLAGQLLDVLCAAHKSGTLHRDIKPENLFVTTDGRLKVLDFGIARVTDEQLGEAATAQGTLLGTPAYLAPEQALGQWDAVDERTDLWAVGATMFQLLTGRFVHEGCTPNEQLGLAMTRPAPSLAEIRPEISDRIARIVDRALSFSQQDRYPTAAAMLEALRGAGLDDSAEPPLPEGSSIDTLAGEGSRGDSRSPQRRLQSAGLIVAIALVVAGVGAGALMSLYARLESTAAADRTAVDSRAPRTVSTTMAAEPAVVTADEPREPDSGPPPAKNAPDKERVARAPRGLATRARDRAKEPAPMPLRAAPPHATGKDLLDKRY